VLGEIRTTRVVLATGHRNHDTADNSPANLAAWCQRRHTVASLSLPARPRPFRRRPWRHRASGQEWPRGQGANRYWRASGCGSSPGRGGTGPGGAGTDRSVPRQRYEAGRWLVETNALRAAGAFPAVSKDNGHVSYGIATHSGAVTTRDTMAPAIRRLPALDGVDRIRPGRSSRLHRVGIEAAASGSACHREPSRPRICWLTIIGSSNGKL
jgi:hypothetical protein